MRLTKFGHACIRIEYDGHVVVVDPGGWTSPEALEGATAVLVTHEHPDHWTPEQLGSCDAPIWTIAAVAAHFPSALRERTTIVTPGDSLDVGVPVDVVGEKHAVIHPELPHFDNSGYLLTLGDRTVFHPGDSLTVPPEVPDVLCLPVSAPWLKASECIDYARAVGAPRSLAIHDAVYSDAGLGIIDGHLARFLDPLSLTYTRLAAGEDL